MTAKTKFEQLIEYVINDEEQKAHELFHDIVVEKSREIYENLMNEEECDDEAEEDLEEGTTGSAAEDLVREVETDEEEMNEGFGEEESEEEGEEAAEFDDEAEEAGEEEGEIEAGEGEIEDRVVDLEDKLDELMAEFEALMGDEAEEGGEEFGMDADSEEVGGDAYATDDTADFTDTEMPMTENVSLAKVATPKGGDNGANAKSPVAANSGAAGMAAKPVRNTATEANPDGTAAYKAPTSYADKGRGDVKGAGSFKNVPGKDGSKLEAAPKPTTAQASGSNTKTPFPRG